MASKVKKSIFTKQFESSDGDIALADFADKTIVLYFYPKDNTSGCTREAEDFRDNLTKFKRQKAIIIGVSRDNLKSHDKFIEKIDINFPLISDPDETLCHAFDVMKEKSMYGRKYMGIERSTFIIDDEGNILHEWRKVKVPEHVNDVLTTLKALK